MITHYVKIAVRNLLKYKTQTIISLIGLAIGLTFFVFGLHWYRFETTFDSFYPLAKRTYQVSIESDETNSGWSPAILRAYFKQECPEVEMSCMGYVNNAIDYVGEEGLHLKLPRFLSADSSFIKMFPQQILYGTTIKHEHEVIISESLARKHWKHPQDAVGCSIKQQSAYKQIHLQGGNTMHIVGVMADMPHNSNFTYDGYIQETYDDENIYEAKNWQYATGFMHITLREGVEPNEVLNKLHTFLRDNQISETFRFKLTVLADKHFAFASKESFSYSAIALFSIASLLLLCCVMFNYLNLSLNRYFGRVREMKLRKVVGASHWKLQLQLMVEVLIGCLFAFLLSGSLLELFIPVFKELFLIPMESNRQIWSEYLLVMGCALLFIELMATLLMGHFIRTATRQTLTVKPITARYAVVRRGSMAIQLVICLLFISMSVVFFRQLHFMRNTDYGFDTEHIIEMQLNPFEENYKAIMNELNKLPMVEYQTGIGQQMIGSNMRTINGIEWDGQSEEQKNTTMLQLDITQYANEVFNFRLVDGAMFPEEEWTVNEHTPRGENGMVIYNKVILNEKAARMLPTKNPIGTTIRIPAHTLLVGELKTTYNSYEVIGVVKDCHFQGMKQESYPMIMMQSVFNTLVKYWRIVPGMEQEALKAFNEVTAKFGWEYQGNNTAPVLLGNKVKEINKSETAIYRLFVWLSVVCMLISLFGIYSISYTTLEQRRKEIAIRKVMGAKMVEVMNLFFREYIVLLLLAALVAFPVAYWGVSQWLQGYAYHIEVGLLMFVVLLLVILALILLTVVQQVYKAARQNPAEVVKSE